MRWLRRMMFLWRSRKFRNDFVRDISTSLLALKIKEGITAEQIAARLGKDEWWVHQQLSKPNDLDAMSGLALAMGHRIELRLIDRN